jgi:hypothetical protein
MPCVILLRTWRRQIARATIQMELLLGISRWFFLPGVFWLARRKLFKAQGTAEVGIELFEPFIGDLWSSGFRLVFRQANRAIFVGIESIELIYQCGLVLRMAEGGAYEGETDGDGCRDGCRIFHLVSWGCCWLLGGRFGEGLTTEDTESTEEKQEG